MTLTLGCELAEQVEDVFESVRVSIWQYAVERRTPDATDEEMSELSSALAYENVDDLC